jgi:hypothetical protein
MTKADTISTMLSSEINELKALLPDWKEHQTNLKEKEDSNSHLNLKQSYLQDRDNLKGNIAHYFLAQLKYAEAKEIEASRKLTLRKYGNLMQKADLLALIDQIEAQLHNMKDLFKQEYDLIYTEYPIYYKGKESRLDRIMINTHLKTYRIIDYKTGETRTDKQLEGYQRLAGRLLPDYKQETEPEFIEIVLK